MGQTNKQPDLKLPEAVKRKDTASGTSQVLAITTNDPRQQTAVTDKSRHQHTACQRFLDRGNKPVPPNYEEQDVLPHIYDQS